MKKTLTILVVLVVSLQTVNAQDTDKPEDHFSEGQYFFVRGDYEDAALYFLKLVEAEPENANFNFKLGESYLNIPGREHLAIPYFEKSLENIVPKKYYNKRDYEEKAAPLHAYFYLGNAYRINNELDKALAAYRKFIDSPFFYGNYNLNIVEQEMKSCERAKIIQDSPLDLKFTNLGEKINTEFAEEKPVLSGDGNTLVFVRRLQFYDAIFCIRKLQGVWQEAFNINPQIISDGEFYPTGLSVDGTRLLLVKKDTQGTDIYYSEFDGNIWSKAMKLQGKVNSSAQETHASFDSSGKKIFLSSNRKGSVGGFDIFISRQHEDGNWSKPKNAGKGINTPFDEQVAYMTKDMDILFFSSTGHYNMGGYDIFYSYKDQKNWSIPINLGYPLNTTRDNFFYHPSMMDRRTGIVALTREEGFGGSDIYMVEIHSQNILEFDK
jgi:tetratricopeptide (TPR) repeat protein